jgi:hypothetical protein
MSTSQLSTAESGEDLDQTLEESIGPDEIVPDVPVITTEISLSEPNQEIVEVFEYIKDHVDNLNALRPSLERPWTRDVDMYSSAISTGSEHSDQPELDLARQLFPCASKTLQTRLGHANYRRKIAQQTAKITIQQMGSIPKKRSSKKPTRQDVAQDAFNFQKPTLKKTETHEIRRDPSDLRSFTNRNLPGQSDAFTRASFLSLTPVQARVPPPESDSESEVASISVFSKSVLSRTASYTTMATLSSRFKPVHPSSHMAASAPLPSLVAEFPKIPIDLESIPKSKTVFFTCYLCGHDIEAEAGNDSSANDKAGNKIRSNEDWKMHVFKDLEPYLCTFDECYSAQDMYAVREEWYRHELETHRVKKVWTCATCLLEFPTKKDAETHLEVHRAEIGEEGISMLKKMLRQTMSHATLDIQNCPLCMDKLKPSETKAHIAKHLEFFALLSVSEADTSDEDDSDERFSRTEDDIMSERGRREKILSTFVQEQFNINRERYPPDLLLEGHNRVDLLEDMSDYDGSKDSESRVGGTRDESKNILMDRMFQSSQRGDPDTLSQSRKQPVDPMTRSTVERLPLLRTGTNPRNDDFMGRDKELANLYKILSEPGRVCVVSAEGGMGKTALAVEFTWRYEHCYHYIFWVQAETPVGSSNTFCQIAVQLGLASEVTDNDTLIRLGREFLENTDDKRWLVVFDNVEKWDDIDIYTPAKTSVTNGSILITTRHEHLTAPSRPVNYFRITLQELDTEEGRKLLIHGLPSELRPKESSLRDSEYKIAGEIATLAGLPLLIVYISGYIKQMGCTLSEFWEYWDEWRPKRLAGSATSKRDPSERDSVFNIALRDLGGEARKILEIMAFLEPDCIQRELLVRNDNGKPGPLYLRVARYVPIIYPGCRLTKLIP